METWEMACSRALWRSLAEGPLLVGDLPEAKVWDSELEALSAGDPLNFEQKLGHLYEDAMERLIQNSDTWELLARNLQVSDADGRTLGEIDFLMRDIRSGTAVHLELAVKFYLAFRDVDGVERFPGPDPRDNWLAKLDRLRTHQLQLCGSEAGRALLDERFGIERVVARQRVYGIIFDPVSASTLSSPPSVSPEARRARWLYVKDWDRYFGGVGRVIVVPKYLWPVLLGEELLRGMDTVDAGELKRRAKERCTLFWDAAARDVVFLVPDGWPRCV